MVVDALKRSNTALKRKVATAIHRHIDDSQWPWMLRDAQRGQPIFIEVSPELLDKWDITRKDFNDSQLGHSMGIFDTNGDAVEKSGANVVSVIEIAQVLGLGKVLPASQRVPDLQYSER